MYLTKAQCDHRHKPNTCMITLAVISIYNSFEGKNNKNKPPDKCRTVYFLFYIDFFIDYPLCFFIILIRSITL